MKDRKSEADLSQAHLDQALNITKSWWVNDLWLTAAAAIEAITAEEAEEAANRAKWRFDELRLMD